MQISNFNDRLDSQMAYEKGQRPQPEISKLSTTQELMVAQLKAQRIKNMKLRNLAQRQHESENSLMQTGQYYFQNFQSRAIMHSSKLKNLKKEILKKSRDFAEVKASERKFQQVQAQIRRAAQMSTSFAPRNVGSSEALAQLTQSGFFSQSSNTEEEEVPATQKYFMPPKPLEKRRARQRTLNRPPIVIQPGASGPAQQATPVPRLQAKDKVMNVVVQLQDASSTQQQTHSQESRLAALPQGQPRVERTHREFLKKVVLQNSPTSDLNSKAASSQLSRQTGLSLRPAPMELRSLNRDIAGYLSPNDQARARQAHRAQVRDASQGPTILKAIPLSQVQLGQRNLKAEASSQRGAAKQVKSLSRMR